MFCRALPNALKEWVEEQASAGHYGNTSDYVRQLIRHGQELKYKIAQMQALVDESLDSGVSEKTVAEILRQAKTLTQAY